MQLEISTGAERRRRSLGAAGVPGRPGREGSTVAQPKALEDVTIQGEKRKGILRTSLNKSFAFQGGIR